MFLFNNLLFLHFFIYIKIENKTYLKRKKILQENRQKKIPHHPYLPGSAAHIPIFSPSSLPSRLIVSVGTFIAPIENCESRPRKAFVCSLNTDKEPGFSVDLVPVSDFLFIRYLFSDSGNSIGSACFVSVNEFRSVERLICFPTSGFCCLPST